MYVYVFPFHRLLSLLLPSPQKKKKKKGIKGERRLSLLEGVGVCGPDGRAGPKRAPQPSKPLGPSDHWPSLPSCHPRCDTSVSDRVAESVGERVGFGGCRGPSRPIITATQFALVVEPPALPRPSWGSGTGRWVALGWHVGHRGCGQEGMASSLVDNSVSGEEADQATFEERVEDRRMMVISLEGGASGQAKER